MSTPPYKDELIQIYVVDRLHGITFFRNALPVFYLLLTSLVLQAQSAAEHLNQGRNFQDIGDFPNAVSMYSRALKSEPDLTAALFNRAACLIEMNENAAAKKDLNHLLRIHPDDLEAMERRGVVEFNLGNWMAAAQDFSRVLQEGTSVDLLLNRATAYLKLEQADLCLADLKLCEKYEPSNGRLHAVYGDFFLYKNDRLKALRYYKKALLSDENNAEVLNNIGYLETQNENFGEAEKYFKKALAVKSDTRIYAHLALAQMKTGNFIEAMDNVALALEPDSKESIAFFVKGRFAMENGNPEEAIDNFNTVIDLDPTYMPAYLQRAKAKRDLDLSEEAKEDLMKVLELAPDNKEARVLLTKD